MPLRVRFRDGPDAGRVVEFGDAVESIRFGRDAEFCDVVLPLEARMVSREHCSLRRVHGQYRLLTNRKAPVLIGGREADDDQILDALTVMQLGRGGPTLLVEIGSESSLESTADLGPVKPAIAAQARAIEERATRAGLLAAIGVAGLVLIGIAGWIGFSIGRDRIERTRGDVENVGRQVSGLERDLAARIAASKPAFHSIYARAEASIYRVEVVSRVGGHESVAPGGTAWVAGPGVLATNAHVAEQFETLLDGQRLQVHGGASGGQIARVESVTMHPGYRAFSKVLQETKAFDPAVGHELDLVPAWDVALLRVAEADAAALGPPLALESAGELERLEAGAPIAFIGFPSEGLIHSGSDMGRPRPTLQIGHVTGVTDFFLGRTDAASAHLVHFSMAAAGGASGSPIFDEGGAVIAILNAGNFSFLAGGSRIPIGGVNYGQRADVIRELLDGSAQASTDARLESWRAEFARLFARGVDGLMIWIARSFETGLREQGHLQHPKATEVLAAEGAIEALGEPGAQSFGIVAPDDGWYLIVAIADRPVDIDAVVQCAAGKESDVSAAYFARIGLRTSAGDPITIRIHSDDASFAPRAPFKLRVFHFGS